MEQGRPRAEKCMGVAGDAMYKPGQDCTRQGSGESKEAVLEMGAGR